MKKLWNNLSITYKIFSITVSMLLIMSISIYSVIYIFLPSYYQKYKEQTTRNDTNEILEILRNKSYKDVMIDNNQKFLYEFAQEKNIDIEIEDSNGNSIFHSKSRTDLIRENEVNMQIAYKDKNIFKMDSKILPSITRFKFNDYDNYFDLKTTGFFQPVQEASIVILRLIPTIFLVVLIISFIGAIIFSKIVTRPMIRISRATRKMSKLDFSDKIENNRKDEIGELADNINILSNNLNIALSNLKESNKKLVSDMEKERKIEEQRRDFIAAISHELKTPLTAIKGQIEGMIYNIGIYKDRDKYLKKTYSISEEMEKLIYQMVDISKTQSFNYVLDKTKFKLDILVKDLVLSNEFIIKEKKITINYKVEDTEIEFDRNLLKKSIDNIISNAIHYSPEKAEITMYSNFKEGLILRTINTGITIGEFELEHIFNPFYRVEKSRNRKNGGSGLGLYIVKNTIELNNLKVKIYNGENSVIVDIFV